MGKIGNNEKKSLSARQVHEVVSAAAAQPV